MKQILLTGDSRGVGLSTLKTLLSTGYKVIGISRTNNDDLDSLKSEYGDMYHHINYDLSDVDGLFELYKNTLKPFGKFDGFVNNAAIAYDDIITNINVGKLKKMYDVNVMTPMVLTKYMIRNSLLTKTNLSIIHISSISAHTGYKGLAMYASTKSAIEAFSKNTAREWGTNRVRSNVVCPGFMDTDMSSTLSDEQKSRIFNRNSRKKEITTIDVAHTIEFLLSEKSKGITGQIIHVDNGTI
jgi:3-oxoacyl-[acyl-carrier protein] reductase